MTSKAALHVLLGMGVLLFGVRSRCFTVCASVLFGQAVGLPDGDAPRSLLGDFGEALNDMSDDEDEMTQEEVSSPGDVILHVP